MKWATPAAGGITFAQNRVDTQESTTSGSYTALSTSQSVTLTTGTKVLVLLGCTFYPNDNNGSGQMSYEISGATTTAISDNWSIYSGQFTNPSRRSGSMISYQTVTAGSNTFTVKFKTNTSSQCDFYRRQIVVIDLGS